MSTSGPSNGPQGGPQPFGASTISSAYSMGAQPAPTQAPASASQPPAPAGPPPPAALRAAREHRLAATILHVASRVPWYREHFAGRALTPDRLRLADFPIVDAATIKRDFTKFYVMDRFPDFIITTGGTSTGVPSIIPRNIDEYEAAWHAGTGQRPGEMMDTSRVPHCMVHLLDNDHGFVFGARHGQPIIGLPLVDQGHAEVVRRFIQEGVVVAGRRIPVRALSGSIGRLKAITAYLHAAGMDTRNAGIAMMLAYSWHATRFWRKIFQDVWGAQTAAAFGMTEINIENPSQCPGCGGYHYQTGVIAEYLHPRTREAADQGDAVLTLTTLVPMTTVSPRIRYWTNDLVRPLPACPRVGERGFRFVGRLESCLVVEEGAQARTILAPPDVLEVLEATPEVAMHGSYFTDFFAKAVAEGRPVLRPGIPVWAMDVSPTGAVIWVELVFDPRVDGARAEHVGRRISDGLHAQVPRLQQDQWDRGLKVDIRLLGPGELKRMGREPLRS